MLDRRCRPWKSTEGCGFQVVLAGLVVAAGFWVPFTVAVAADTVTPVVAVDESKPVLVVPFLEQAPVIEDFLDDARSQPFLTTMARAEGFVQQIPEDGQPASQTTEAFIGYDARNLYVVFLARDAEPERIRSHMARRESIFAEDLVEIMLDTFGDGQRAYAFVVTPLGIQWDAIWTEGQGFDMSWDTVWQSRGRLTDWGYVVWMAIPFKSLRFPAGGGQDWGVILLRDIPRNNETSFWPRVSSRIEGRLNQAATLRGLEGISPGRNIQLIPYATSRRFRLLEGENAEVVRNSFDADVGLDAKLVLKDRMALDLTVNPDFAQVESDQPQLTVNERFELFFPEKRPFFLENAGFFRTPFDLLFTRRIREPRAGSRVTGKLGSFAIGALLADDESPPEDEIDGHARFGVLRVSRDLPRQSNIGMIYTDRIFKTHLDGELQTGSNRVGGIDGRFKLDDNWDARFQAVYSSTVEPDDDEPDGERRLSDPAFNLVVNRQGRQFNTHAHYQDVGRDFRTRTGFVPRTDVRDYHQSASYAFRPEGPKLIAWEPGIFVEHITDHDGTRLDWNIRPIVGWEFRRQTEFDLFTRWGRLRLRPGDLEGLEQTYDFSTRVHGLSFSTRFIRSVHANGSFEIGRGVNFAPAVVNVVDGEEEYAPPSPTDDLEAVLGFTLRPGKRLRLETSYLLRSLDDHETGRRVLKSQIARTRLGWQFNPKLSVRTILEYVRTTADASLTRAEPGEQFNADLLVTYLINPWTAFYAGYNSNYQDWIFEDSGGGPPGVRIERDLLNDARQVFVKASYLFRF